MIPSVRGLSDPKKFWAVVFPPVQGVITYVLIEKKAPGARMQKAYCQSMASQMYYLMMGQEALGVGVVGGAALMGTGVLADVAISSGALAGTPVLINTVIGAGEYNLAASMTTATTTGMIGGPAL